MAPFAEAPPQAGPEQAPHTRDTPLFISARHHFSVCGSFTSSMAVQKLIQDTHTAAGLLWFVHFEGILVTCSAVNN